MNIAILKERHKLASSGSRCTRDGEKLIGWMWP